jgi:hypothetical protein
MRSATGVGAMPAPDLRTPVSGPGTRRQYLWVVVGPAAPDQCGWQPRAPSSSPASAAAIALDSVRQHMKLRLAIRRDDAAAAIVLILALIGSTATIRSVF